MLTLKKYWYIVLFVVILVLVYILGLVERGKLVNLVWWVRRKRFEVEKEIEKRRRLEEMNIGKIDKEYEKKLKEIDEKIEKEFNEAKTLDKLDELALKLFGRRR